MNWPQRGLSVASVIYAHAKVPTCWLYPSFKCQLLRVKCTALRQHELHFQRITDNVITHKKSEVNS